jgi:hypothetical protein
MSFGGHDRLSYKFSLDFGVSNYSVFGNRWRMLKEILMIVGIFGCLNGAPAKRPVAEDGPLYPNWTSIWSGFVCAALINT